MTAEVIYALCAATSGFCCALLFRAFVRTRFPLLLWSSAAFLAFTAANVILFIDLVLLTTVDLSIYRNAVTLLGIIMLLCGLVLNS